MAWPVAQRDPAWITLCHNGRKNVRCAPVRHGGNDDGQPPTVTTAATWKRLYNGRYVDHHPGY
jgi:hypothetical protein